jgi:hypothetical protein
MQYFLKKSALGLLTIALTAGLAYVVLTPPPATAALPSAAEIAVHSSRCSVCRLPLYGHGAVSSRFGPDTHVSSDVAETTRRGAIEK